MLEAIEAQPATRAGDLADSFGREKAEFKVDVRKLKNLGLTISLRHRLPALAAGRGVPPCVAQHTTVSR